MGQKPQRPAWWLLPVLVPLLAGLFVVEQRASLTPGAHTAMQVGIVLFIYGLVWMWLRANTFRLLWSNQGESYQERVIEGPGAPISLPKTHLSPRQAHFFRVRAGHAYRRSALKAKRVSKKLPSSPLPPFVKGRSQDFLDTLFKRGRMRKCSVNSDRQ